MKKQHFHQLLGVLGALAFAITGCLIISQLNSFIPMFGNRTDYTITMDSRQLKIGISYPIVVTAHLIKHSVTLILLLKTPCKARKMAIHYNLAKAVMAKFITPLL